jgi:hypothetical protein
MGPDQERFELNAPKRWQSIPGCPHIWYIRRLCAPKTIRFFKKLSNKIMKKERAEFV